MTSSSCPAGYVGCVKSCAICVFMPSLSTSGWTVSPVVKLGQAATFATGARVCCQSSSLRSSCNCCRTCSVSTTHTRLHEINPLPQPKPPLLGQGSAKPVSNGNAVEVEPAITLPFLCPATHTACWLSRSPPFPQVLPCATKVQRGIYHGCYMITYYYYYDYDYVSCLILIICVYYHYN